MDDFLSKINKLSLPATILIAAVILGGFYLAVEYNKQRSIERQQQIKIEQEKQDQLAKELKDQQAKEEAEMQAQLNITLLNACLSDVQEVYIKNWNSNCKNSGLDKKTELCSLPQHTADALDDLKEKRRAECFKKYP